MPESDELEFIGSSESVFLTVAAYRTTLVPADAVQAASALLREADWRERQFGQPPRGGFVTGAAPRVEMLCRDTSMLSVVGSTANDTTYVRLQVSATSGGLPCNSIPDGPGGPLDRMAALSSFYDQLPTLVLPEGAAAMDPQMGLAAVPIGLSGNNQNMSTQIELETDLPAQDLVEDFGRQLQDQGWTYDAGWSGAYSSGSGWTRSPDGGPQLTGLLDTVALAGSGYRASFRISMRDPE